MAFVPLFQNHYIIEVKEGQDRRKSVKAELVNLFVFIKAIIFGIVVMGVSQFLDEDLIFFELLLMLRHRIHDLLHAYTFFRHIFWLALVTPPKGIIVLGMALVYAAGAFLFILLRRREKYGIIHMLNHASFRFLRRRKNLENFITMHPRMDGSV